MITAENLTVSQDDEVSTGAKQTRKENIRGGHPEQPEILPRVAATEEGSRTSKIIIRVSGSLAPLVTTTSSLGLISLRQRKTPAQTPPWSKPPTQAFHKAQSYCGARAASLFLRF